MPANAQKFTLATELHDILVRATDTGLLDIVAANCKNPDAVNDFCDAVLCLAEKRNTDDSLIAAVEQALASYTPTIVHPVGEKTGSEIPAPKWVITCRIALAKARGEQ
jgi:hypothetical protein